jgi:ABC-type Zn2+ transport system substrate-binding protein/surface adhesin
LRETDIGCDDFVLPFSELRQKDIAMDNKHTHDEHRGHDHDEHGHDHAEHEHGLVEVTIELEDEHIPALDEVATELTRELKQPWDRGAVVRLALSEFFSRRGKIT